MKCKTKDPLFKDSKEKDIEVIEHADSIKEEVETVVDILRTKIPFLYEFSDPELQDLLSKYGKI